MATAVVGLTDPQGSVISIPGLRPLKPALCDTCNNLDIAEDIPAFEARTLSQKKREALIAHAKRCKPCRLKLGWGEL